MAESEYGHDTGEDEGQVGLVTASLAGTDVRVPEGERGGGGGVLSLTEQRLGNLRC